MKNPSFDHYKLVVMLGGMSDSFVDMVAVVFLMRYAAGCWIVRLRRHVWLGAVSRWL